MADLSTLGPINAKSTVDILIDRLTQAIIEGTYKAGDRIPTETELAEVFGVGRNTVREALRTLIAYGVLETRRPSGTFVCDKVKPSGLNPMIYGMILRSDDSYQNLISLRKMFETGLMLLLSDMAISEEQWQELYQRADELRDAIAGNPADVQEIIEKDIRFHDSLTALMENPLLEQVSGMITKLTYASRIKTIENVLKHGQEQYLINTHYNLLRTLEKGDAAQLYQAVQDSYLIWKDVYKEE